MIDGRPCDCRADRSARRRAAPAGSTASARAMPTRCCWPPDSSSGRWARVLGEADQLQQLGDPGVALGRGIRRSAAAPRRSRPPTGSGSGRTTGTRSRSTAPQRQRARPRSSAADVVAVDPDACPRSAVQAAEQVEQGGLARAGRPRTTSSSPGCDGRARRRDGDDLTGRRTEGARSRASARSTGGHDGSSSSSCGASRPDADVVGLEREPHAVAHARAAQVNSCGQLQPARRGRAPRTPRRCCAPGRARRRAYAAQGLGGGAAVADLHGARDLLGHRGSWVTISDRHVRARR